VRNEFLRVRSAKKQLFKVALSEKECAALERREHPILSPSLSSLHILAYIMPNNMDDIMVDIEETAGSMGDTIQVDIAEAPEALFSNPPCSPPH
jgi:hypothetical protein